MNRFVDETVIEISSGNGGAGAVHFRREKYVPRGGPDGGDGGKGGDVVFAVRSNLKTLSSIRMKRVFKAENGHSGTGQRKHGRGGRDVVIEVPPGTLIQDNNGQLIKDLGDSGEPWVCLKGGIGGRGNWHFRTSTRQAPRYAQNGIPGESQQVRLELQLIADIGLVGLPNAGKSTLLSELTHAHPKIAAYPFTTKIPHIGVMPFYDHDIILADIPGIIEGAAQGAGLGLRFLKHVNRTRALAFLIDMGEPDPGVILNTLQTELRSYSTELIKKPSIVVGTKLDLDGAADALSAFSAQLVSETVIGISAWTGEGLEDLRKHMDILARS